MCGRVIAIGDIHGCSAALEGLVEAISPGATDTLITLGDYVDRGSDSRGVLDRLIALAGRCQLVPLLGNHDEMMLNCRRSEQDCGFGGLLTALDVHSGQCWQVDESGRMITE